MICNRIFTFVFKLILCHVSREPSCQDVIIHSWLTKINMLLLLPQTDTAWISGLLSSINALLPFELEKEMATHSSIHAWKIPWTEEPGGLQPMGSQRVILVEYFSSTCILASNGIIIIILYSEFSLNMTH